MSNYRTIEIAEAFKALSNPNRLQIFQKLLSCCEIGTTCSTETISGFCVGELGENLDIAPSTLSHHIKELQRAGLIKTQRHGKNIECFVNTEIVETLKKFFSDNIYT